MNQQTRPLAHPVRNTTYLTPQQEKRAWFRANLFLCFRKESASFNPANEFWAAIPDREKNQTQVGRYNLKDFSFETLLVLPHISFDSMSMWVDEPGSKLYVVYESQLLRIPLSKTN